jgi:hypothetical protein
LHGGALEDADREGGEECGEDHNDGEAEAAMTLGLVMPQMSCSPVGLRINP